MFYWRCIFIIFVMKQIRCTNYPEIISSVNLYMLEAYMPSPGGIHHICTAIGMCYMFRWLAAGWVRMELHPNLPTCQSPKCTTYTNCCTYTVNSSWWWTNMDNYWWWANINTSWWWANMNTSWWWTNMNTSWWWANINTSWWWANMDTSWWWANMNTSWWWANMNTSWWWANMNTSWWWANMNTSWWWANMTETYRGWLMR
jgi:hypothetical protein